MSRVAGYKDEDYIRGKAPMTKREVRILTISLLGIQEKDIVVDIGAGTGGLTMEAAYAANEGRVYAVEAKDAALELEKQNIEKFGADNVTIISGKAPAVLEEIKEKVDKVIIGGTGGQLEEIFVWCKEHLNPGGRLVANFVTMEKCIPGHNPDAQILYRCGHDSGWGQPG